MGREHDGHVDPFGWVGDVEADDDCAHDLARFGGGGLGVEVVCAVEDEFVLCVLVRIVDFDCFGDSTFFVGDNVEEFFAARFGDQAVAFYANAARVIADDGVEYVG